MKKKFVLQNAIDKKYWYGFYTKKWTDTIIDAKLFDNKTEIEDWIENNMVEIQGMFLITHEVWY